MALLKLSGSEVDEKGFLIGSLCVRLVRDQSGYSVRCPLASVLFWVCDWSSGRGRGPPVRSLCPARPGEAPPGCGRPGGVDASDCWGLLEDTVICVKREGRQGRVLNVGEEAGRRSSGTPSVPSVSGVLLLRV